MISAKNTLRINLGIIAQNYINLRNVCNNVEVGASIKANCYGLGMDCIAPVLEKSGCRNFFVATCDEGVELRKIIAKQSNIYVLQGVFADDIELFHLHNLIPVLNHLKQVNIWYKFAIKLDKKLPCIIHVDTGMHRLGMSSQELTQCRLIKKQSYLNIDYIMSHLACAEEGQNSYNQMQLEKFNNLVEPFAGIKKSFANSGGIFLGPDYHFDLVRPGAAIYGINLNCNISSQLLQNPVELLVPIIQLHELLPGESVGYNNTYTNNSKESCLIATIPIGYADGLPRSLSNKGFVYIAGIKVPIIGRISMDLTIINVSLISREHLFLGQIVEIMGKNNNPDDLAQLSDTNSYEILTRIGTRFNKIYI